MKQPRKFPTTVSAIAVTTALLVAGIPAAAEALTSLSSLRRDVEFLASPELEGRLTGSEGAQRAAGYLAEQLEAIGAIPLPGRENFYVPFEFTAGTLDLGSSLTVSRPDSDEPLLFKGEEQIRALSFTEDGSVSGDVVFAGYGLVVQDGNDFSYDSYVDLDVQDKLVLVLRYFPEDVEGDTRAALAQYAGLRYKALLARERGARALLVVTGPNSPNAGETVEMSFDSALSGSGIVAASVGGEIGDAILSHAGKTLAEVQTALDSGNPHVTGFAIPDLDLDLDVRVERERRTGRNVVGVLAAGEEHRASDRNAVMLGAHFDHLGHGRHGSSLAREDEAGQIHLGADDNASGVAAVLEAGRLLSRLDLRGPVVLAFWSGEELGLLGSTKFIESGGVKPERFGAYLNFDMVGRMRDNKLTLQAVASSTAWPRLVEQANVVVGFDVVTHDDPYLPTDASTLYLAGVPTLAFFTGGHEDYHRPSDGADKVNYEDLERVVQFTALVVRRLDGLPEGPAFVKVEQRPEREGSRDGVRAYTGTIPDYTTEVVGLRLAGVAGGGPADKAGLREGDVVVEFAGKKITNIYDYTYALDAVKIGEPVDVVCLREGQRIELTIEPTARP